MQPSVICSEPTRCLHISPVLMYNSVSSCLCCVAVPPQEFFLLGGVERSVQDRQPTCMGVHTQPCTSMLEQRSRSVQQIENPAYVSWINWVVMSSPITICLSHRVCFPFYGVKWGNVFFKWLMVWMFWICPKLISQKRGEIPLNVWMWTPPLVSTVQKLRRYILNTGAALEA